MAGATNRALKAAGIPKSTIATLRVEHGSGLSLRSALGIAHERGLPVGKAAEFHAAREAKHAASPAGQAAAADFRAKAATALKAARERKAAMLAERQKRVAGTVRALGKGMLAQRKAAAVPKGRTISDALKAAGWTKTDASALGPIVSKKGEDWVTPKSKAIGEPIRLRQLLPHGAKVSTKDGTGVVDYKPRSGYVRLSAGQDHDSPHGVLRDMILAGARVHG
jgi:hypothetical protein